ncbi:DUF2281 domain-containing protein [Candidatus Marithrix sp. Canyon 246]|uniref:DUF2281 domain-containing protein n=1 Tax=Candidatus Marithrix sp. Canyon 246 TaxID=1827136 RepID=UPI00084A2085|nr:DUF2281 domain-containing protein [Candidatus Marithrix sp. Canyon 246]
MDIVNNIYHNLERLPSQQKSEVLDFIEYLIFKNDKKLAASQTHRSILELRGLGKHVWQNISVKDYINAERDSWNG